MKLTTEMLAAAAQYNLACVNGDVNTAIGNPAFGFNGRRVYVNNAPPFAEFSGNCLHLSGFTPDESELLGAVPNQLVENKKTGKREYFASARISGFLPLTQENVAAALEMLRDATSPAWERTGSGETAKAKAEASGVFAAIVASK